MRASDRSRRKSSKLPGIRSVISPTISRTTKSPSAATRFSRSVAAACSKRLYAVMWSSLVKLAALPGETQIYCGHEYTQANGRFAITIEPDNPVLKARIEEVARLRAAGRPTAADDHRSRACRQSVSARGGASGSGCGRHGRGGACGGVWGAPRAQGPILRRLSLLGQKFEALLHVGKLIAQFVDVVLGIRLLGRRFRGRGRRRRTARTSPASD